MPKLKLVAENVTAEQIELISEFIFKNKSDKFDKGRFSFKIRPDFNKENILELGWQYIKTNDVGISTFEYMIFDLDLHPDGEVRITEGSMEERFRGKIESKKHLKQLMSILQIS